MKTSTWKRLLCLLMAAAMLLALAACGSSSTSDESTSTTEETTEEITEETTAEEESEAAEEESEPAAEEETADSEEAPAEETTEEAAEEADLKAKWSSLSGMTLTVGTTGTQMGWSQDDGADGIEGMDVDVMTYICDYYGIEIEWVISDSSGLWGMLQNGQIDTIASLTTVNEDRLNLYWFTNTYAWESYCIVSRIEDGIPEDGDLSFWDGKTITTVATGNPALILESIIEERAAEGATIESLLLDSSPVLIPAVAQNQADGALMCTSTAAYIVESSGYADTMTIQDIQYQNMPIVYGWARTESNKDLILAFNDLIEQMHEDGTLTEMSMKWFNMDVTEVPDGEVNYVTTTGDDAWQSYEN